MVTKFFHRWSVFLCELAKVIVCPIDTLHADRKFLCCLSIIVTSRVVTMKWFNKWIIYTRNTIVSNTWMLFLSFLFAFRDGRPVSSVVEHRTSMWEVAASNPSRTNTQGLKIIEEKVLPLL